MSPRKIAALLAVAGACLLSCGDPNYWPPIYVLFNVHGHDYQLSGAEVARPDWWAIKAQRYARHREEILWVRDEAERHGIRVSFQLNGEYARDARVLRTDGDGDDTDHIRDLVARGHSVGVHFHPARFTGVREFWEPVPMSLVTPAVAREMFEQHVGEVEAALGASVRRIDAALDWSSAEMVAEYAALMAEFGLDLEPAGEDFTYTPWQGLPWSPFRRQGGTKLREDASSPWLTIPTHGQTGEAIPRGLHAVVGTVPQIERRFLELVAERDQARATGQPWRVWAMGFLTHPDQNALFREDVTALMDWLVAQFGPASPRPIVQFVTDAELASIFETWEAARPGASSFDFDWEGWLAGVFTADPGDDVAYPYGTEGVALALADAEVVRRRDELSAQGIVVWELEHRAVTRGPRQENGLEPVLGVGDADAEHPLFLVYSLGGEARVDFSGVLAGTLFVKDGVTGEVSTTGASDLAVGPAPRVVSATDLYLR